MATTVWCKYFLAGSTYPSVLSCGVAQIQQGFDAQS